MPEQHNIFRSSGRSPSSRLFLSIKFKALIKIFDKNVLRGSQKQAQLRLSFFPGLSYSLVTSRMPAIKESAQMDDLQLGIALFCLDRGSHSDCFSLPDSSVFLKIDQLLPPAPH